MTDPKDTAVAEPTDDRPEVIHEAGTITDEEFEEIDLGEDDEDDDA